MTTTTTETTFDLGDTVVLKSGGPLMTINSKVLNSMGRITNEVECIWFDSTTLKRDTFHVASLKKGNYK